MQCAQCGSRSLRIEVGFTGFIACRFRENDEFDVIEPVSLDSDWNDDSPCECMQCDWIGTVADARSAGHGDAPEGSGAGSGSPSTGRGVAVESRIRTLEDVKEQLKLRCEDPVSRECIEYLVSEVERLGSLLESVQRVAEKERDDQTYGDTSVM